MNELQAIEEKCRLYVAATKLDLVDGHRSIGRFLQQFRAELFDEFGTGLDGNFGSQQLLLLSSSPRSCLRRVTQLGDNGSFGALRL